MVSDHEDSESLKPRDGLQIPSNNLTYPSFPAESLNNRFSIPRKPIPLTQTVSISSSQTSTKKSAANQSLLENKLPKTRWYSMRTPSFLDSWWLELSACIIVIGMLLAIVFTLYPHQGHPLPNWPYHLSINTLIAVFTTILKAALLVILAEGLSQLKWEWLKKGGQLKQWTKYDAASRGPVGCIQLVFGVGFRDMLAIVGAILTILALFLDPFTQQLIHFYDCQIPSTQQSASVSRTNAYFEEGEHQGAGLIEISPDMISAVEAGVFNPTFINTEFVCPTGNCTLSNSYSTLGWCASCLDVTHNLTVKSSNVTVHYSDGTSTKVPIVNTSLPSGLNATYSGGLGSEIEGWFVMGFNNDTFEFIFAATTTNTSDHGQKAHPFARLATDDPCSTSYDNSTWGCSGPGAASCSVVPCVKTFNATVDAGKLTETLLETSQSWMSGGLIDALAFTTIDLSCLNGEQIQTLNQFGINTSGSRWLSQDPLPNNATIDVLTTGSYNDIVYSGAIISHGSTNLSIPPQCIYEIAALNVNGIESYFEEFFTARIVPTANEDAFDGPSQALAIFNDTFVNTASINKTFQNIAESMTAYVRRTGGSNYSQPALGVTLDNATCVGVRWAWLAFPTAVALMTIVFFIVLVLRTETSANNVTRGWKSSLLPLLFRDFDGIDQKKQDVSADVGIKEMDALAAETHVMLPPLDSR